MRGDSIARQKLRTISGSNKAYSQEKIKQIKVQISSINAKQPSKHNSYTSLPAFSSLEKPKDKNYPFWTTKNDSNAPNLKSSEQLHQQNHNLKSKIHSLNTIMSKERVRKEINFKNIKRIHDKINAEYSEEVLVDNLPHKSHLVEGVKHQYYSIKKKYEDKCKEMEEMMKQVSSTQILELKMYCSTLEKDNQLLKERVARMLRTEEELFEQLQVQQIFEIKKNGGLQANNEWKQEQKIKIKCLLGVGSKIAMLEQRIKDITINLEDLKQKSIVQKQVLKQRKQKIQSLQNIIKKQSNQHHASMTKLSKKLKQNENIIIKLKLSIQQQQKKHQQTTKTLILKNKEKLQTQKDVFQRYLHQRQLETKSLKKQIKKMSFMQSSPKNSTQQFNSIKFNEQKLNLVIQDKKQQQSNEIKDASIVNKFQLTFNKQQNIEPPKKQSPQELSLKQAPNQFFTNEKETEYSLKKQEKKSTKAKPIRQADIEHLKKELGYKLIFHRLNIDRAKEYLNITTDQLQNLSNSRQSWVTQYISLQQLKQKLQKYPFSLAQKDAIMLGRYIVEDSTQCFVYLHEENQVERTVAKSILRAFVGDYQLPVQRLAKSQIRDCLIKKGKNIQSILNKLAPKGYISDIKLKQVFQNLQIQISESSWNFLVSQLYANSQSLSQLDYSKLQLCV